MPQLTQIIEAIVTFTKLDNIYSYTDEKGTEAFIVYEDQPDFTQNFLSMFTDMTGAELTEEELKQGLRAMGYEKSRHPHVWLKQ